MNQASPLSDSNALARSQLLQLVLPVSAVAVLAVLAATQPLWALAGLVVVGLTAALLKWPEAATLTAFFILYSNAAKVAVDFHGVPYLLGVSFFVLLAIPLFSYIVLSRHRVVVPMELAFMSLFVVVQFLGATFAKHPDWAMKEVVSTATEGLLLYFLTVNVVRSPETLRRVIWTLVAAGVFMSAAPLYQQVSGNFSDNLGGFGQVSDAAFATELAAAGADVKVQPRLAGSIGEQNRFAQVMLMLVPLALLRWHGESSKRLRMLGAVAAAIILLAVVLTFSRGAAVAIGVLLLAMAWLRYLQFRHLVWVSVALMGILLMVPQYSTRLTKLVGVWELMDSEVGVGSADGSIKSRVTEMGAAALVFLDHPWIGVGPDMFRFHYREYAERIGLKVNPKNRGSHSLYPGLAAESGLLGTLLFTLVMFCTLRDLSRVHRWCSAHHRQHASMIASFVLVIVAYLATAMFLHLAYARFFWLMMGLAHAATRVVIPLSTAPPKNLQASA